MRGKSTEFTRDFDDQAQSPVLKQDAPKSGNSESRLFPEHSLPVLCSMTEY